MSLIEIMFAVAIVGILASLATVGYQQYIHKVGRSDAKAALVELSQELERCFTINNAYNAAGCEVSDHTTEGGHYAVTISNLGTNTYTLIATAQGQRQKQDTECRVLRMNHDGTRSSENAAGDATTDCW